MHDADRQAHWNNVYASKDEREVSWFEESPAISMELIRVAGAARSDAIIDIGGGASRLVDALLAEGYTDISVLDLASCAVDVARSRLGAAGQSVRWIVGDVTTWTPDRPYDLWHDRATFHFLTEEADRTAYARCVLRAVKSGGHVIMGTFAPEGPERCSGLPVRRYDSAMIAGFLGSSFELVHDRRYEHRTPAGAIQAFQFGIFRKRG